MRASLRRRIFAGLAGAILIAVVGTSVVWSLLSRLNESPWSHQYTQALHWAGDRFAERWDDPSGLAAFTRSTAHTLDVGVTIMGPDGVVLLQEGPHCARGMPIEVARGGLRLGQVLICRRHAPWGGWQGPVVLVFVVLMLWLLAGKVARRLARPLDELKLVAQRIGGGELSARAELSYEDPGEIGVVADAINEMAARIEKQLADQRELLATVSHELRTPLARVRIISELAREAGSTQKTFDDLDREVAEMDSLVGELLASSRVAFGILSKRPLALRDVATHALERSGLDPALLMLEGELTTLDADATLLQRALANLLANAAAHGGGVERLRVESGPTTVRFEVLDRGPGLPQPASALFEKFKASAGEGLGLGLALVRRIAHAHGGGVFADNRPSGGACVGFWVPVNSAPPASSQSA